MQKIKMLSILLFLWLFLGLQSTFAHLIIVGSHHGTLAHHYHTSVASLDEVCGDNDCAKHCETIEKEKTTTVIQKKVSLYNGKYIHSSPIYIGGSSEKDQIITIHFPNRSPLAWNKLLPRIGPVVRIL